MERENKISIILRQISPHLIYCPGIEDVLEGLRPFISALDVDRIRQLLVERDSCAAWQYLIEVMNSSGINAFEQFRSIIKTNENFATIRNYFELLCKNQDMVEDGLRKRNVSLPSTYCENQYQESRPGSFLIEKFKEIIVANNSTEEDKQNLKKICVQQLEKGYKFNFVMVKAIIDDLLAYTNTTHETIYKARIALQSLLPYAVNLCRCPNRQEYSIVKKYTSYFQCKIKNNFLFSPDMVDSILASMGYKQTKFPDEVQVERVSTSILDIALDLYMSDLELERILNLVYHATTNLNCTVNDVLIAMMKESRGRSDSWHAIEVINCIQSIFKSSRESLQTRVNSESNDLGKLSNVNEPYKQDITKVCSVKPVLGATNSLMKDDNEMPRRAKSSGYHNQDSNDDWMYDADGKVEPVIILKPPGDDVSITGDTLREIRGSSRLRTEASYLSAGNGIGSTVRQTIGQGLSEDDWRKTNIFPNRLTPSNENLYQNYHVSVPGQSVRVSSKETCNNRRPSYPRTYDDYSLTSSSNSLSSPEKLPAYNADYMPDIYNAHKTY